MEYEGEWVIHQDDHIKLGDIECIWIYLDKVEVGETKTIWLSFHLQAETGNEYQADKAEFDVELLLNQEGAPDPSSNKILLENKDTTYWKPILGDGKWGIAEYNPGSLTLDVTVHGLSANTEYQVKLTSPEKNKPWYPITDDEQKTLASALASDVYSSTTGTAPP